MPTPLLYRTTLVVYLHHQYEGVRVPYSLAQAVVCYRTTVYTQGVRSQDNLFCHLTIVIVNAEIFYKYLHTVATIATFCTKCIDTLTH